MNARYQSKYEDKEKKNVTFRKRVASIVDIQAYKNDHIDDGAVHEENRKEKVRCRCILF